MFTTILTTLALTLGLSLGAPIESTVAPVEIIGPPVIEQNERPCMTSRLCEDDDNTSGPSV